MTDIQVVLIAAVFAVMLFEDTVNAGEENGFDDIQESWLTMFVFISSGILYSRLIRASSKGC